MPFHAGGQEANLLVPMYGVVAAAAVVAGWRMLRGAPDPVRLGWIGWAAAALIMFSALSMLWTVDPHEGSVEMLFFYLPFGFLLARLGGLAPGTRDLKVALGVQVALALVFAAVAFFQEATHHLFWNPKVIVGNEYAVVLPRQLAVLGREHLRPLPRAHAGAAGRRLRLQADGHGRCWR